jgi:hypothetical protein
MYRSAAVPDRDLINDVIDFIFALLIDGRAK